MNLDAATQHYLVELVFRLRAVLADRLDAVWLFGSAAYGGYDPARSDLDVHAAASGEVAAGEARRVADVLAPEALPCPAAGLELVLYESSVLRTPALPLAWTLNLNVERDRTRHVGLDPGAEPWHWFVLDLAMGRALGRALYGPAPHEVIGEIARERVVDAVRASLTWHDENEPGSANAVGNAARALRFLETGAWGSKPDGLAWLVATRRTPERAVGELRRVLGTV